ncbi:MAG: tRNA (N(6)-L-threonylcarbamoyladenosine(37)-C(2))-methylthiotransferase MtaB [Erysipelotrichaceae bacterium]
MKSFAVFTLGCKVNLYESESYIYQLKQLGYQEVSNDEVADVYIINTCTVTNSASSKSRKMINKAHKLNKQAFICVVGCYVQTYLTDLEQLDFVDLLIGAQDKDKLAYLIDHKLRSNIVSDTTNLEFENLNVKQFHHTRAYLKVQDGCDQFCSYCIIPYARGNSRCMNKEEVMKQARVLAKTHHEIVLVGIHTGRYEDNGYRLSDLIEDLIKIDDLKRIRLSSIEINEIDDKLVNLIKNSDKVAKHLHIPLQAGCDKTLKMMNRPYETNYFYQRITKIRQIIPNISISSDVIVGFPSESEEDFITSLNFVEKCQFSFLHVFPFSLRKNTKANDIVNIVIDMDKKNRSIMLIALGKKLALNYKKRFIDQRLSVLVETCLDDYSLGYSSEYLQVKIINNKLHNNQIYECYIFDVDQGMLIGEVE